MAHLVGFYLQYIKRYTYIIIITYKGINVIIIVWLRIIAPHFTKPC